MEQAPRRVIGKCFGSAVVGPRGQLVIPVDARRELGLDAGTKLLAFNLFERNGVVLVKVEAVEELLNMMSHHVSELARLLKETETAQQEQ
jgi:bifunctional DNA-binding transcriptional regulator/antitoxin component of YhaV-PrlF toxin-antitoxin module